MKTVIVLALSVAAVLSAPVDPQEIHKLPALVHKEMHTDKGEFELYYVTADGTTAKERGYLVLNTDGSDVVMVYEGEYSFIGDDGKTYFTKYATDYKGAHQAPKPETKPELQPVAQPALHPAPAAQPEFQPATQPELQSVAQPEFQPATQPELQPAAQPELLPTAQPELQSSAQPDATS